MTTSYTNQTLPIPGDIRYLAVDAGNQHARRNCLILVRVLGNTVAGDYEVVPVAGDNTCMIVGAHELLKQVNAEPYR